ncbi:hypothetical protein [Kaistella jeonii]|uniref:Uncharacterized protein n=1 Tax=Kaistella jeonii TaxID=266749 RepID=A0A0C1F5K4_9FLAO|nr:hypothetical protein [Kaistella jeonii]KIA88492.1 hypothetical protein OA86_10680 [Kaistella jeonii]SFC18327.1 hypothetical protein SAMN05421876_10899 [Kaistella jeonii]VEI95462.1 Uncharacterised protein [Kaistella jeonii]
MKFGFRTPSLKKRISAQISPKRYLRDNLGFKVPKGYGLFTNPKKAVYNKLYNKTSTGCILLIAQISISVFIVLFFIRH